MKSCDRIARISAQINGLLCKIIGSIIYAALEFTWQCWSSMRNGRLLNFGVCVYGQNCGRNFCINIDSQFH